MRAIHRKLLRDLWAMRSQVVTVALVVASAFSGFAGSIATYHTLERARDDFYASARFGHVFADCKRAPRALEERILAIPDVTDASTTVAFDVRLNVPGVAQPLVGRLVGIGPGGERGLDALLIRRGRAPDPARTGEVVISEGFSTVRGLAPGQTLRALINGREQQLEIVGIGLAPDYIYATQGGAFPDDRNFGVLWMDRKQLATAFEMEGAFNHVSLRIADPRSERAAIAALDALLEPYGGMAAHGRDEQTSHRILAQEVDQWKVMGTLIPSIFLGVAAFLLNVVLHRQISTQREQIAALKALGYGNGAIAAHYLQQVAVVVALGIATGVGVGIWFGRAVSALYAEFFHFPAYRFELPLWVALIGIGLTAGAALAGATGAVLRAVRLAPAEAMRPPFPGRYRPALLERLGLRRLPVAVRMTIRNLERRPLRACVTTCGIAAGMAIIISGLFWRDALEDIIAVQFEAAQRADGMVTLVEQLDRRTLLEMRRLPGTLRVEATRDVPVRIVARHRTYRTVLQGIGADGELRRPVDRALRRVALPPEGMLLTDRLAERLGVLPGDTVSVEVLTGKRQRLVITVAGTVHELIGLSAYMDREALDRALGEGERISGFAVRLDASASTTLFAALNAYPRVAVVAGKAAMLQNFRDTTARNILFFTGVLTAFAVVIAVGVVYNHARIALQERAWELASLRVLGFTRGEVSTYLLGELAIETAVALPLGGILGFALAWTIVHLTHQDMIAIPVIVTARTYAYAALTILIASGASALIVRRRIDRLDLVAVLKTRE